jgi:hypothetical protein
MTTMHLPVGRVLAPARTGPRAVTTYRVSALLALVALVAGLGTWLIPGLLNGNAAMNGSARGTGAVLALIGVPALLWCAALAHAGSIRAHLVWLGMCGYVVYNAVLLSFATPFNELFLVYEALLGLAIACLVMVAMRVRAEWLDAYAVPARPVAGYLLAITAANSVLWLSSVVSGLGNTDHPKPVDGTGLVTNPVIVQDLAVWLPLAALAGVWLWQRKPWGLVLGAAVTTMWVMEAISVAVDQWMGATADPSSPVVSKSIVPMFAVLAVVGVGVLVALLRDADPSRPIRR